MDSTTDIEASRRLLTEEIRDLIRDLISDPPWPDVSRVADISSGHCSEFLDMLGQRGILRLDYTAAGNDPARPQMIACSILNGFKDVGTHVEAPPGMSLEEIEGSALRNALDHAWIHFAGLNYDAEVPKGVPKVFEVPCLRRALVEGLRMTNPVRLERLVGQSRWWQQSLQMEQAFSGKASPQSAAPPVVPTPAF